GDHGLRIARDGEVGARQRRYNLAPRVVDSHAYADRPASGPVNDGRPRLTRLEIGRQTGDPPHRPALCSFRRGCAHRPDPLAHGRMVPPAVRLGMDVGLVPPYRLGRRGTGEGKATEPG